ncbi:sporulation integral membrane protein YlbJ [Clostridium sp. 19966]|uniref:sporulation integral membrane protein YlbJ n=1 Tax=Clostridium sp. 19966 TaxID=2768166 RepID=UPI0028DFCD3E|nr:sporulation integral membrane protein YlbJ [Clostridium sp. 19966]MDT8716460.1 sporulation integral membrane protein YlbJ [Clostridium sp. 19966]
MLAILICLIIAIIILVLYLSKSLNINRIIIFICTFFIIYFIALPKTCINSTISGTKMFFVSVFPSLFAFLIICNILIKYNGINIYAKIIGKPLCAPLRLPASCSLVLIISALCGYPLGAKYSSELYDKKIIDFNTFERLINIASNASPVFIVGTVGISMLNSNIIGYLLLATSYMTCIIMSLILPINNKNHNFRSENSFKKNNNEDKSSLNIGIVLKESIEGSIKSSLSIGGYIIFFSVIIDTLKNSFASRYLLYHVFGNSIFSNIIYSLCLGLIEITNGCKLLSELSIPLYTKGVIISFLMSFGGLSILSQVYSFLCKYQNISIKKYIRRKLLQGCISSMVFSILFFSFESYSTLSTFYAEKTNSISPLYILPLLILIIPMLLFRMKRLFHIS